VASLGGREQLPVPQRDALDVAFGIEAGPAPDRFMVGLAVLGLVAAAAEQQPQVFLVDDAQWLDQVSAQTLAFVARRLLAERVVMVFAVRETGAAPVLSGLPELIVPGLADDDARALLDVVIQGPVDEGVRERTVAETRGNPLALIELPRGLTPAQLAGGFGLPDTLSLAGGIERSFLERLRPLPGDTRRLLLAGAADPVGDATLLWSAAALMGIAIDAAGPAEAAGLVEISSQVRFRHPLVRSAVYRSASAGECREIHRVLATVTDPVLDPDRRAWHRAQAAAGPDEEIAAELESSAQRAQARGGAAATAAFLERAAALTPDRERRARRGLEAATAKRHAGALSAALALLVAVEHGPPDGLRSAQVTRLRGRLALDLQHGTDASQLLLTAARALEPLDTALARQTHLEALGAAIWAAGLHQTATADLDEAARAALAAPPGPQPPRPGDVVLDALALRVTAGFAAAAPALTRALETLRTPSPERDVDRWLWSAGNNVSAIFAMELFDSEARYALCAGGVEVARETGALVQLQAGLHYLAHTNLHAGELATAASQIEESVSIADATGNPPLAYAELALAAYRGREAEATALIDGTERTASANGQDRTFAFATYASAVLYNGIGRHEAARDAALAVIEGNVLGYGSLVIAELAEAASRTGDTHLIRVALTWIRERTAVTPSDWSTGIEARIRALLDGGDDIDQLHRDSIALLATSPTSPPTACPTPRSPCHPQHPLSSSSTEPMPTPAAGRPSSSGSWRPTCRFARSSTRCAASIPMRPTWQA
jgi:hypothetical protein